MNKCINFFNKNVLPTPNLSTVVYMNLKFKVFRTGKCTKILMTHPGLHVFVQSNAF